MLSILPQPGAILSRPAPELRLSRQERNRLRVAKHINKDPETYRAKCRAQERHRLATDPIFREMKNQRKLVTYLVKGPKGGNIPGMSIKTGYSGQMLRDHLEAQWLPGMTWANYGRAWNVDHIKPVSAFVKEGERRASVISALSNLRPMWRFDNASKHKRDAPSVPDYGPKERGFRIGEKNGPKGEKHHLAVLTVADVAKIKARLAVNAHGLITALAREYGVHPNTIRMIKQEKTWKEVEAA